MTRDQLATVATRKIVTQLDGLGAPYVQLDGMAPENKELRKELWALADAWLEWLRTNQFGGGCFFVAASAEFQGRPGAVRERLVAHQRDWLDVIATVARTAIAEGTLPEDTDLALFAYEFHAAGLIHQHATRLLDDPRAEDLAHEAFERLIPAAAAA